MRIILVLAASLCVSACGENGRIKQAAQQEAIELAACRTTYPVRAGLFASRIRCELGAAANYVQVVDPSELDHQRRVNADLQAQADAVDQGSLTAEQWQAKLSDTIKSLPSDAKHVQHATSALL